MSEEQVYYVAESVKDILVANRNRVHVGLTEAS
jgi:hypothetical protein